VRPDDKAFEQKGPFEGGRFLGWTQKECNRKFRKDMPQMKGLKEHIVAGQATKLQIWQYLLVHTGCRGTCHIFFCPVPDEK